MKNDFKGILYHICILCYLCGYSLANDHSADPSGKQDSPDNKELAESVITYVRDNTILVIQRDLEKIRIQKKSVLDDLLEYLWNNGIDPSFLRGKDIRVRQDRLEKELLDREVELLLLPTHPQDESTEIVETVLRKQIELLKNQIEHDQRVLLARYRLLSDVEPLMVDYHLLRQRQFELMRLLDLLKSEDLESSHINEDMIIQQLHDSSSFSVRIFKQLESMESALKNICIGGIPF